MESAASSIRPIAVKLGEEFLEFVNKAVSPFHVVGLCMSSGTHENISVTPPVDAQSSKLFQAMVSSQLNGPMIKKGIPSTNIFQEGELVVGCHRVQGRRPSGMEEFSSIKKEGACTIQSGSTKESDRLLRIRASNQLISGTIGVFQRVKLPMILIDKDIHYTGEWKNGMRDGQGTQKFPDGSVYEGDWLEDRATGKGRLTHDNGDFYDGDWLNDKADGDGAYYSKNRPVYEGQWKDDKQHGRGRENFPDGTKYEGEFQFGKKHGKGTLTLPDGSVYTGDFKTDEIHGIGTYVWPDGKKYEGEWVNNQKHGKGKLNWPDGRLYEGHFQNDLKHGEGTFTWPDGKQYIGGWYKGKQNGRGILITAKGKQRIGEWANGKRIYWVENTSTRRDSVDSQKDSPHRKSVVLHVD